MPLPPVTQLKCRYTGAFSHGRYLPQTSRRPPFDLPYTRKRNLISENLTQIENELYLLNLFLAKPSIHEEGKGYGRCMGSVGN